MGSGRRIVGVDESGKGDFFGPLVIASFLADDGDSQKLTGLGVRDGKLISNKRLLEIDRQLRGEYPHAVVVVTPQEYNRRYAQVKNLNKLLAEGHAEAITRVVKKHPVDLAVSDKFGKAELVEEALSATGSAVKLSQIVRGETVVQVAAASILARARFIREIEELSLMCRLELPRGAAPKVDEAGRRLVRRWGAQILSRVAKLHFKNYQRIVSPTLFQK